MFENLTTPEELLAFRLGSLLSGEHDSLDMLEELQKIVSTEELRSVFAEHADETRRQIQNVERCLEIAGKPGDESPSPTTAGLAKEAHSLLRKVDDSLQDAVALSAGLETEHLEIGTYTGLITLAESCGQQEVGDLLAANLREEVEAADKVARALRKAQGLT